MKAAFLLLVAAAVSFAADAKLTFTKTFPGSIPPFVFVSVDRSGALTYKEAANDDQPVTAKLSDADAASMFDMAQKLHYFHDPLESGLKVANTGKKTFRYEDGQNAPSEVAFNYSINEIAQQLLDKFEQIAATERAYLELDRTVHFDKLGVNDALATVESLWLRRTLSAPDQFMPLLKRIAAHESFMMIARDRAAKLMDEFKAGQAPVNTAKAQ